MYECQRRTADTGRNHAYQPCDFVFKIAATSAELEGFYELRRQVFCDEQKIFTDTDRDRYDRMMIPIICTSLIAGMEDLVVGAVRIDQRSPSVWWGSRLCVHRDFRKLRWISPGVPVRNRQPGFYAKRSIGAGLIYKAVSSAHALGCQSFLAHVQQQNAVFFRRLHWKVLREIQLYGIDHVEMEADLAFYPPAGERLDAIRVA